tara:strand:- start:953 stop:1540 length:588 start_codon:yes stop_codon:yes gene_type:complete
MRVEHQIILKFSELSEEAKQKAHENYITKGMIDFDIEENRKSLNEFEKYFPIKIKDWEYGYRNFINWEMDYLDNEILELKGNRLRTYLINNYMDGLEKPKTYYSKNYKKKRKSKIQKSIDCPFTGFYLDNEILQPIFNFIKNPDKYQDLESIMNDCLNEWISICNANIEYQESSEYFEEMVEANEYEFLENGDLI